MDPLLIIILAVVGGGLFVMYQKKRNLSEQARSSLHSMLDESFEFQADEVGPSPTGKFRVEQMLRNTTDRQTPTGGNGKASGPALENLFGKFASDEDDD